jgi:meso-butanediol dehydrogenase/(S,S)-butanediol dehydrogenase/diacetyl reductase
MRFEGKTVIVTGGTGGIGFATASAFAKEGATVIIAGRDEKKSVGAAQKIQATNGSRALGLKCDVSDEKNVIETVEKVIADFGRLDVVVNNAGVMIFKAIEQMTTEDFLKVLSVDLLGAFYFIKQAFLQMKSGGAIINISSIHAIETEPLVTAYAASKAALVSLTRSAALEGKPKNIRVNAVLPGAIDTGMLWNNPNVKSGVEVINKANVGSAGDVANVILFLASSEAEFVQGASIIVDGGRLGKL